MYYDQHWKRRLFANKMIFPLRKAWFVISRLRIAWQRFDSPLGSSIRFIVSKGPYRVSFKDGHVYSSYNFYKFYDSRSMPNSVFEHENIRLHHADRGACEEVFGGAYSWLPVENRTVLDIGANIGDSSVYFATRGATKIFALEVNTATYEIGKTNVRGNKLEEKIEFLNVGIGLGTVEVKAKNDYDGEFQPRHAESGTMGNVTLRSLDDVVSALGIEDAVMKIDCEGCEYSAILEAECDTLSMFSHIMGEYHYGASELIKKLNSCGFDLQFSRPSYYFDPSKENPDCLIGTFRAWRSNKSSHLSNNPK